MQKYFVTFSQSVKNLNIKKNNFLKYGILKYISFIYMYVDPKFFFSFKIFHFRLFLYHISKTYIFIHVKKTCITSSVRSGGGVKALADTSTKNASIFYMLPIADSFYNNLNMTLVNYECYFNRATYPSQ